MLPCFFTKQFRDGDHVVVCRHIYNENIRDGHPLSLRMAEMKRHDPPVFVEYGEDETSRCDVGVKCLKCANKKPPITSVEMIWSKGRLKLSPLALKGAA